MSRPGPQDISSVRPSICLCACLWPTPTRMDEAPASPPAAEGAMLPTEEKGEALASSERPALPT